LASCKLKASKIISVVKFFCLGLSARRVSKELKLNYKTVLSLFDKTVIPSQRTTNPPVIFLVKLNWTKPTLVVDVKAKGVEEQPPRLQPLV
jgi:hypothetical protein